MASQWFWGKSGGLGQAHRLVVLGLVLLSLACGRKAIGITQCVLPEDQKGTLKGYWPVTPIPWAVSWFDFKDDPLRQKVVLSAINEWNNFSKVSLGYPIFSPMGDYPGTVPEQIRLSTVAKEGINCSSMYILDPVTNQFKAPVAVHLQSNWEQVHPDLPNTIALMTPCTTEGSGRFKLAYIELNTQSYWASGKPVPDMKSIVLHELGHVLGLGHSCEDGSKQTGVADCVSNRLPKDYRRAVMYPSFQFYSENNPEVRDRLKSNDMGRFNCIYNNPAN